MRLLFLLLLAFPAHARTYPVGPEREIKSLKAIAPQLKPGDVVEIDPGVYRETVTLTANGTKDAPITIRGVGAERPMFDAEGLDTSGRGPIPRGIFQIEGAYWVIEHLEFKNARNGENAAGIRLLDSTNAVIRDCKVSRCDMGVFGGDRETATIENCDVGFNSTKEHDGYAHNFYMHGNRVVVRHCRIHDCPYGQNFKSRAHTNELWHNWIADSSEGEVGPVDAKGATDRPHSNTLLVGNVLVSPRERSGNTWKFIIFGQDTGNAHDGTLTLFHNTFVAGSPKIKFITLSSPQARLVARGNVFVGGNQILSTLAPPLSVTGSHNWLTAGATAPAGWTENFSGGDPGFVDAARGDFHLKPDALAAKISAGPWEYEDGDGIKHALPAVPGLGAFDF